MVIFQLLQRDLVNGHVSVNSKRQALQTLAEMAGRTLGFESQTIFNALMLREKQGSTGVGHGVAVPHAVLDGLTKMTGLFIRLEAPIEYEAIDDVPVDLIFCLLAPIGAENEHLRALARVSRTLRQKDLREQLRLIDNSDALYSLLTQHTASNVA